MGARRSSADRRVAAAVAAFVASAAPALALAQARTLPDEVPAGGLASAWPLGIIVVLVAAMVLVGAWAARRSGASGGGGR